VCCGSFSTHRGAQRVGHWVPAPLLNPSDIRFAVLSCLVKADIDQLVGNCLVGVIHSEVLVVGVVFVVSPPMLIVGQVASMFPR